MPAVPNTFVVDTTIDPDEVNENFDTIYDFVNEEVIHRDGTIAFTAVPTGPATDPSTANQLARKDYVDRHAPNLKQARLQGTGGTGSEGSYTNLGGRLRVQNFVKRSATSELWISVTHPFYSSDALGLWHVGVKINADAAVEIDRGIGSSTGAKGGTYTDSNRAAGTFDVEVQIKSTGGATYVFPDGEWASLTVMEVEAATA